ncbi:hypothetical protein [uncultured Pontibacter sp.]|uniref:hypothetical protein n=1 Tax=uncultured Pontibacter sp. TaxID=453356 RepID=UPI00262CC559|nr:hypothetical protein [uncultured Pontibacter sp.]
MVDTALVAVIFPSNIPFLKDFLFSVASQSEKSFDLILINDGVASLTDVLGEQKYLVKEVLNIDGNPFEIRVKAINEIAKKGYKKLIFSDTDDVLSHNRVEVLTNELDVFPIVCNDLDITDVEGNLLEKGYWRSRLGSRHVFDQTFLLDKNIVGFGNTGIRLDNELPKLDNHPNLVAPDWFFFFRFLDEGREALFSSSCSIGYRQHESNIIGLKAVNEDRLIKTINCKIQHYSELVKVGYKLNKELESLHFLRKDLVKETKRVQEVLEELKEKKLNYFWWEETNNII